jgi:hypothetical protein
MTPRTQMHLRLSESDYRFLKDRAAELDESVAALIRRILKGYRTKCEQVAPRVSTERPRRD